MHAQMSLAAIKAAAWGDATQTQSCVPEAIRYPKCQLPRAGGRADVVEASEDTGLAIPFYFGMPARQNASRRAHASAHLASEPIVPEASQPREATARRLTYWWSLSSRAH